LVAARNIANYRDPAVILIDQMKEIWIDGELETVETANWFPKVTRKDYQIGVNVTGSGVDDPDQQFFENYGCRSARGGKHSSSNLGDQVLALATGKTQQEIAAACKGARANHVGAACARSGRLTPIVGRIASPIPDCSTRCSCNRLIFGAQFRPWEPLLAFDDQQGDGLRCAQPGWPRQ
jgi:hypothetical protein